MNRLKCIAVCALMLPVFIAGCVNSKPQKDARKEKTAFQTGGQWKPATDTRADVAIVYGAGDRRNMTFEERVQSWRDRGYTTHFMTGIAWGGYQDYFTGKWDGQWHLDEGQKTMRGDTIWHGRMVPYIVPTMNYLKYLKEVHVKRVIDAGIDAIHMEEPEFWMRAGYSEAFKREWQEYYGFPWRPQDESPENTYLSNKLKYHLYYRALEDVFTYAKEYGKTKGMDVRCYVPTHSLVNYSSWQIVSPEASLASLPCVDGYIAQVWTGTAREPNYYNGVEQERVFETAFLEYGSMESMTRPTGRKMFFLTDPIEDWPRDWPDFKKNYQATFTAQLLYPMIDNYEVMPWPDRIYEGLYRTDPNSEERERIPRFYSTQMQVMINSLNDMPTSDNKVSGSQGIGVMMSNSLMFQRYPTHNVGDTDSRFGSAEYFNRGSMQMMEENFADPKFSNFYGQTLPLLKRGVPVSIVHIENTGYQETWKDMKVLVMSYANMKPMKAEYHNHIADWVKAGGVVVYCGTDTDAYQTVMEWWNRDGNSYARPADHLFEKMGIGANPAEGEYSYGKGAVYVIRTDPKEFVLNAGGDAKYLEVVKNMYENRAKGGALQFKNDFTLERGPYDLIAVLNEGVSDKPYTVKGVFIDMFDPKLPVYTEKTVAPGEQAYLYNVGRVENKKKPQILAAAARAYDEQAKGRSYTFVMKSPVETTNVMRVLLPAKPVSCSVKDHMGMEMSRAQWEWDEVSKTCLLTFENHPNGVTVALSW